MDTVKEERIGESMNGRREEDGERGKLKATEDLHISTKLPMLP